MFGELSLHASLITKLSKNMIFNVSNLRRKMVNISFTIFNFRCTYQEMTRSKPPIDKEEEFKRLAAQMFNFRSKSLILLFDFE